MTSAPLLAAIETGGTKLLYRLVNGGGAIVAEGRFDTGAPDASIALLAGAIRKDVPFGATLDAVGVASFGPIVVDPASPRYGHMLATTKPGWTGFDLRGALQSELGAPVVIDTDVNAAALAEQLVGAGRGKRAVAYVTVGTGIGGGFAIDGQTLKGSPHPEIGHIRLGRRVGDVSASLCPFHLDCAEGLTAGPAVRIRLGGRHDLAEAPDVLELTAHYLAQLCSTLTLAWSPDCIVLGGGVLDAGGLMGAVRTELRAQLGSYGGADAIDTASYLVPAELRHAGLEGAVLMARTLQEMTHA
jgi:fructokinase